MADVILAFGLPGGLEMIIIAFMFSIFCLLPLGMVVWLIVSVGKLKAENKSLRIEMDKLTNELDVLRDS